MLTKKGSQWSSFNDIDTQLRTRLVSRRHIYPAAQLFRISDGTGNRFYRPSRTRKLDCPHQEVVELEVVL